MKPFLEVDEKGNARLVIDGERSHWHSYQTPIFFQGYVAFSGYWFPKETIMRVVDKKEIEQITHVCSKCGQENGWNGETFGPQVCEHLREKYPEMIRTSQQMDRLPDSRYGVICPEHGPQGMEYEEYMRQLGKADSLWVCPIANCRQASEFDEGRYEART